MLYKEMLLIGEDYDYFIEMDPAGNGIRFMRVGDDACHALGARHSYEKTGS